MREKSKVMYICESCGREYKDKEDIWKCSLCGVEDVCEMCSKLPVIFRYSPRLKNAVIDLIEEESSFGENGLLDSVCIACNKEVEKLLFVKEKEVAEAFLHLLLSLKQKGEESQ